MPYTKPTPTQIRSCRKLWMVVYSIPALTCLSALTSHGRGMDLHTCLEWVCALMWWQGWSSTTMCCPSTAMLVRWTPRGFLTWNFVSGKQHILVTVASTTTSPAKPWSKRQGKLCGAAPLPNKCVVCWDAQRPWFFCAQGFFCELKPYGKDVEIRKFECVYHAISGWGQPSEN